MLSSLPSTCRLWGLLCPGHGALRAGDQGASADGHLRGASAAGALHSEVPEELGFQVTACTACAACAQEPAHTQLAAVEVGMLACTV